MNNFKINKTVLILFISCINILQAQNVFVVNGQIQDIETNKGLPYVSISIKNKFYGTVSNNEGFFSFRIQKAQKKDTLQISYIGYEDKEILVDTIKHKLLIKLHERIPILNEIILTPLLPEDYIKMAVNEMPNYFPNKAYITQSYYNNKCKINNEILRDQESFFNTYHSIENDTIEHQLLLYNDNNITSGKISEFYSETSIDIKGQFNTPNFILERGKTSSDELCLDSTNFKNLSYKFNPIQIPGYRSILFTSKKPINYVELSGEIILDKNSNAIVSINYEGTINIPLKIKPLLFLAGYRIKNPKIKSKRSYRNINNLWYINFIEIELYVKIEKKKIFKTNKQFDCMFYQIFNVNNTIIDDVKIIHPDKLFDEDLPYDSQIFNENNILWKEINRITPANSLIINQ